MQYNIQYINGASISNVTATTSGYYVRFHTDINATNTNLSLNTTSPSYTNTTYLTNYHKASSKPTFLTVELVNGSSIIDRSIVPIIFAAGATLEITDTITSTVQGHTTSISNLGNSLNTLSGTVDNMEIGGYNIIRYTAKPKYRSINDAYNSASDGTWCNAGAGSGTRELIEISDAPVNGIEKGFRATVTSNNNASTWFRYNNVPVMPNAEYTLTCYARATSGTPTFALQQGQGNTRGAGEAQHT